MLQDLSLSINNQVNWAISAAGHRAIAVPSLRQIGFPWTFSGATFKILLVTPNRLFGRYRASLD